LRIQAGGGSYSYVRLDDGSTNGYLLKNLSSATDNGALAGALYTYTDNNKAFQHIHAGTALFTILSSGNVGIGTTSPSQKLDVNGNIRVQGVGSYLYFDTDGGTSQVWMRTVNLYELSIYNNRGTRSEIRLGNSNLQFFTGEDNERMRITSGGNVGIGTTSPATKLNINIGNGGSNGTFALRIGGTDNYPSLELGIFGAYDGMITSYGNDIRYYSGHWRTIGSTASEDHSHYWFTSKSGSNNWSSTKMRLDHNGDLIVLGNITAYGSPSDIRYKENINALGKCLDKLIQIRGVSFTWKQETDSHKITQLTDDIGFIAQEVQQVFPEIVRGDLDGMLSIRDRSLIAIMVEAIKEQNQRIDILQNTVDILTAKLNTR